MLLHFDDTAIELPEFGCFGTEASIPGKSGKGVGLGEVTEDGARTPKLRSVGASPNRTESGYGANAILSCQLQGKPGVLKIRH